MNIKSYYTTNFPTDELGLEINPTATFDGLVDILNNYGDVYEYIGVMDSLVRERLFFGLSEITTTEYEVIYDIWMQSACV